MTHDATCRQCTGALPASGLSRRGLLSRIGMGLGSIALANLVSPARLFAGSGQERGILGGHLHHPATAKRVIYLFMAGGPAQSDTLAFQPVLPYRHTCQTP